MEQKVMGHNKRNHNFKYCELGFQEDFDTGLSV